MIVIFGVNLEWVKLIWFFYVYVLFFFGVFVKLDVVVFEIVDFVGKKIVVMGGIFEDLVIMDDVFDGVEIICFGDNVVIIVVYVFG